MPRSWLWADLTSGLDNWGENIGLFLKGLWKQFKESFSMIWDTVKSYLSKISDFSWLWKSAAEMEIERKEKIPGLKKTEPKKAPRIPPNRAEAEARRKIDFQGKLSIAGAPKGSTFESKTRGAPPIKTELAGANI